MELVQCCHCPDSKAPHGVKLLTFPRGLIATLRCFPSNSWSVSLEAGPGVTGDFHWNTPGLCVGGRSGSAVGWFLTGISIPGWVISSASQPPSTEPASNSSCCFHCRLDYSSPFAAVMWNWASLLYFYSSWLWWAFFGFISCCSSLWSKRSAANKQGTRKPSVIPGTLLLAGSGRVMGDSTRVMGREPTNKWQLQINLLWVGEVLFSEMRNWY